MALAVDEVKGMVLERVRPRGDSEACGREFEERERQRETEREERQREREKDGREREREIPLRPRHWAAPGWCAGRRSTPPIMTTYKKLLYCTTIHQRERERVCH